MSSIRNKDGYWINSSVFTEEARHFAKYGYYCPDPVGSLAYYEYWKEQRRRRKEGYTVGGVTITGDHYHYLNFSQIKMQVKTTEKEQLATKNRSSAKKSFFPSFWDGDYDYFHNVNIARYGCTPEYLKYLNLNSNIPQHLDGGYHLCVGKARRKGFSYKNGSLVVNRYDLIPEAINIVGAYDKKFLYPEGTMQMASNYINFLSKHTAWGKKRDFTDKIDHKKASYKLTNDSGIIIEDGYKSVIMALSFKDNPDAARGKDGTLILFEEAGKFPNLKDSLKATLPTLNDGTSITGQIIVFGTGSGAEDKEADWEDFADIFYNPTEYEMQVFLNEYDEDFFGDPCSFFFPNWMNQLGNIDDQGNSKKEEAIKFKLDKFEKIKESSKKGASALNGYLQEYCDKPSEAFLVSNNNEFPTQLLKNRYSKLMTGGLHEILATNIELYKDANGVISYKILTDAEPLLHWKPKSANLAGNIIMYEPPLKNVEPGTYILGLDPIRETSKTQGISTNACYVHKGLNNFSYLGNTLVASLIGRPKSQDEYYRNLVLLSQFYGNAPIMHENEVIDVRNYFRRKNLLHLLAPEPKSLINLHIEDSQVSREYGTHMVEKLKIAGLRYLNDWLTEELPNGTLVVDNLNCPGLIEELIKYNREKDKAKKANYDRIMAMLQIMFYRANEDEGKIYENEKKENKLTRMYEFLNSQYR